MPTQTSTVVDTKSPLEAGRPSSDPISDHEGQFFWSYTEEPHKTRRHAILKAHPEVSPFPREMQCLMRALQLLMGTGHEALRA